MSAMMTTVADLRRIAAEGRRPSFVAPAPVLAEMRRRRGFRRIMRRLVDGEWRSVFLEGQIAQRVYARLRKRREQATAEEMLVHVNLVENAVTMHADIIAGNEPSVSVPDIGYEAQAAWLEAMRSATLWPATYHEAALRVNVDGECPLRVVRAQGQTAIAVEDCAQWFAVGAPGPDKQPSFWEQRWVVEGAKRAGSRREELWLVVERHRMVEGRAVIETEAYETETRDVLVDLAGLTRVQLDRPWSYLSGDAPEAVAETGVPVPLVTQLVNSNIHGRPRTRLTPGDLELLDTLTAKFTDIDRTLHIHGRPKLKASEHFVQARQRTDGAVDLDQDVLIDPNDELRYLVAELNHEELLRGFSLAAQWALVRLEMPAALIGYKPQGGAAPDSHDKLRLESTQALSAARRASVYHDAALGRALTAASWVESLSPQSSLRGFAVAAVTTRTRPELPKDTVARGEEQGRLLSYGVTSERAALIEVHGLTRGEEIYAERQDERRREAELARLSVFDPVAPEAGAGSGGAA